MFPGWVLRLRKYIYMIIYMPSAQAHGSSCACCSVGMSSSLGVPSKAGPWAVTPRRHTMLLPLLLGWGRACRDSGRGDDVPSGPPLPGALLAGPGVVVIPRPAGDTPSWTTQGAGGWVGSSPGQLGPGQRERSLTSQCSMCVCLLCVFPA